MEIVIGGNPKGQTVFLLAGYPDSSSVFEENITRELQDRYRIVGLTIPWTAARQRWFGYTMDQLISMLHAAVAAGMADDTSKRRPLLVVHDWGCVIAFEYLFREPFAFERIAALDVGGHVAGDQHDSNRFNLAGRLIGQHAAAPLKKSLLLLYQCWIMVAYLLPAIVGGLMVQGLARASGRPTYPRSVPPQSHMGWIYVQLWWLLLLRHPLITHSRFVPVHVPTLYIYGDNKPFQFHSCRWVQHITEKGRHDGRSKVLAVQGGHWFFATDPCRQITCDEIKSFFSS
jgi:pimeloyl-ACP methyl ester carboxylesterase